MAIRRFIILAATCVFAKQSLEPILCGRLQLEGACPSHLPPAPLLPKLRGHFAEFLFHGSLEHLRLLASPTCVGLRYGRSLHSHPRLFSAASVEHSWRSKLRTRHPVSPLGKSFTPFPDYPVASGHPTPDSASASASPLVINTQRPAREYSPVSHRLRLSPST